MCSKPISGRNFSLVFRGANEISSIRNVGKSKCKFICEIVNISDDKAKKKQ